MISVAAVGSASDAAGYYARDNYYTADEQEGASTWVGEGAAKLGLSGSVDAKQFERVLAGELPNGVVLEAKRGEHRAGWDLTMSAPKSLSLLALIGGDQRLVEAVRDSAGATLGWVERNLVETRTWNGRVQETVRTGNLVAATFVHDVNRKGEPQLHAHAVVANATRAPDGRWHALKPDELYHRQHVMGAVFNAELRARVEALGYATVLRPDGRDGAFEIAGVSRAVVEAFSTRSAEIRAHLDAHGREGTARERELAALATRDPKTPEFAPEARAEGWRALAAEKGLDAAALVGRALKEAGRGETVWTRAVRGLRGAGERGLALAGRMGLTPRDGDPLVPERLGRLEPRAYAAAQAVASAVRDLGEREAAFDRLDLIRVALERGGPVTVADIEARMALLEAKGLLVGESGRMVTTSGAIRLEQAHLAAVDEGRGRSAPLVYGPEAAARAQEAARELELRRLNPGQEAAASLILSSSDRVVNIQGGPGRGKSAVLAPVVAIAKAEGRAVIGLAIAGRTARTLGKDTGATSSTVAGFLARHARLVDGTAQLKQVERATAELKGSVVLLDEASQVGTRDMERLVRLANMVEVTRLVLVGDTRQLGAVDAGKPFERSQQAGHATAHLTENLRSRSEQMKTVTAALERGEVGSAFAVLRPATVEVARDKVPLTAARMWAALPTAERESTLLLASGRAMRSAANVAAQSELKMAGELSGPAMTLTVLDRVTVTREGARQERAYQVGRVVDIRTDLPSQQLARGTRGLVVGVERGQVVLRMADGSHRLFLPDRLPRNLKHDAVTVYALKQIELQTGDRIRWTDNDHARDMLNAGLARVEAVGERSLTISSLVDGSVHELGKGDRMLERLDLAYALNVHAAQGVTTDHGIVMMSAAERRLASEKSFLVAVTRIADQATLVVDSGRDLERAVMRNPGEKTSAMDVGRAMSEPASRVSVQDRIARDPSLDLTTLRVPVEPRGPDLPFPEKDIGLEL
ncbi:MULTISPECIES: MobF family relaxase [Alphaproteobacteria]|uniref:MobF family relaxase n=2 Tax=Bacteria TaxID=2 RepID=UPI00260BB476|nr:MULTISPECIES: MobF family relaxase [Alphaproteobacteria]